MKKLLALVLLIASTTGARAQDVDVATFTRKPEKLAPAVLTQLAGSYQTPTGTKIQVRYQETSGLWLVPPGAPPLPLNQAKGLRFRTPQFSDTVFEFVMDNGQVTALKERDPGGEIVYPKA